MGNSIAGLGTGRKYSCISDIQWDENYAIIVDDFLNAYAYIVVSINMNIVIIKKEIGVRGDPPCWFELALQ